MSAITEAPLGTPLTEPGVSTVQRSSGDVFMADVASRTVDVFSASGVFITRVGEGLEPSGVAVDESSGDVFVSSGATLDVFKRDGKGGYESLSQWSGAGAPGGGFGELRGVAVDNSGGPDAGDVYLVDGINNVVDVFKPRPAGPEEGQEGSFVAALTGTTLEEPNGVAVDASSGRVFVADSVKGLVDVYSPSGVFESKLTGAGSPQGTFRGVEGEEGNVSAIAVDEGSLYVAEAERRVVSQFNAAGEWVGWVLGTPSGSFAEPAGVAVAPGGELYVADSLGSRLDLFGPGVLVPDAKTTAASKDGKTSAVLNGVVNGDGKPTNYHFEWGTSEAYGQVTSTQSTGTSEQKVMVEVTGLSPGTSYHFRLVAENENGQNVGADRELETLPAVEGLSTGAVQNLEPTEATLTGSLAPNGTDARYLFQWGTSASYGNSTPSTDAGSGKEPVAAQAELQALSPNTTYHYRLVASNSFGTTTGEDADFTTSGPPQIQPKPPSAIAHEAATINANVDPGELESTYHFEYGTTTGYGSETPSGKLAASTAFQPVFASLSGLKIGTIYHYRLIAENSAGTTTGPDETVETVPPAPIEGTSSIEVSSTTATLEAEVNPLGHNTTYYFQYGAQPCKPNPAACTDVPSPPGSDIGSGESPVAVSQKALELKPQTTYRYRAVAINMLGTSEGPEQTLTTQPAETPLALADNRAWEMVTPVDKHGAPVEALTREGGVILAAEDGNSITYVANGSIEEEPQGNRSPEQQQDISVRAPGGWVAQDIATPNAQAYGVNPGNPPEYRFFTPQLSDALVEPYGAEPFLAPEASERTPYIRDNASGSYLALLTEANVVKGAEFSTSVQFVDATPDLGRVLVASQVALTSPPSGPGLYLWSGGKLQFVSVLPDGTAAKEVEGGFDGHALARALSNDGSRVVWTSREENTGGGHLYLRDISKGETLQIDAAQGTSEPETGSAEFQTASTDGAKIFFTDKQRLTADSTAQPNFPEKSDLYECEVNEEHGKLACQLRDLTVDRVPGQSAGVEGLVFGASEEGSSIYLVAQGVLASNENGSGEIAQAGDNNLYLIRESGGKWLTTFIAQLSGEDAPEWHGNGIADSAFLTARVSPSGRYLAFMSAASPTGYDNRDEATGKRDEEVYLYDSREATLTCVSCNPTGSRPHGVLDTLEAGEGLGLLVDRRKVWAAPGHEQTLAGNIPGWTAQSLTSALFQSRYLNDEGRLFFNSPDHLMPNATSGKEAVYEYEPTGVGSCASSSGGCVSLISSASADRESAFLEATPSGDDVFFLTAAPLFAQDTDTAFDIYDARVCTLASPCLTTPTPSPPGCSEANACRPAQAVQPAPLGSNGSATVTAEGDRAQAQPRLATKVVGHSRPLTRAQRLAIALKSCRKLQGRKKRLHCEKQARRRYGPVAKPKRRAVRGRRS